MNRGLKMVHIESTTTNHAAVAIRFLNIFAPIHASTILMLQLKARKNVLMQAWTPGIQGAK
jgi:hypothetical protein